MDRYFLRLAAVALACVACASPLFAQGTSDARFRAEAPFLLIAAFSDRMLNDMRFGCAAGKVPELEARQRKKGNPHAAPDALCLAVLKEAAKRGNEGYLYSDLQPGKALDELRRIIRAASRNQPTYINVDGVTKNVSCELALDAGYVFGRKQSQRFKPELSDDSLVVIARRCYATNDKPTPVEAFAAGVRIAQSDAKEQQSAPKR